MKKLVICFLVVGCLLMSGCGKDKEKVAVTLDEFSTVSSDNNFVVNDNTSAYKNVDYVIDAKVAILDDIQIEMVKYTDVEHAEKVQNGQIDNFNLLKNTGANNIKDKGSNYYHYALVSNGYYMVSSRIDDTLIFCKTLLENKETVEKIYDNLGY